MGWLNDEELKKFKRVGRDVKVSRHAIVYGAGNVELGDNVRIDAQVIILATHGSLIVGAHTHIAVQVVLLCTGGIRLGEFTALGFGTKLISASDSFSGDYLIGPQFDPDMVKIDARPIVLERLAVCGAGCIVLPGVTMAEGSTLGAATLLKVDTSPWVCYTGRPARAVFKRSRRASTLAKQWERSYATLGAGHPTPIPAPAPS